jgi:hypothetical protein
MKKNTINFFFKSIMLLSLVTLLLAGCKKSDSNANQDPGNPGNTNVSYKFSSPQNITSIVNNTDFGQKAFVSTNHIYSRSNSSGKYMTFGSSQLIFPNEQNVTTPRQIRAVTGPFCVDKNEEYLYVIVADHLYKCNITTLNVANLTPLTLDLGQCSFIKALDNGDVIFATD